MSILTGPFRSPSTWRWYDFPLFVGVVILICVAFSG